MHIAVSNLSFGFQRRSLVLDNVNIDFQLGLTALLGQNGAGKSTLLRILATELPIQTGHVVFNGQELTDKVSAAYRKLVGWVPQDEVVLPNETPLEHVSRVAWLRGVHSSLAKEKAQLALDKVHLGQQARLPSKKLSGGMRRRVSVAAGLVHEPQLLLLDEPTAGLDPLLREDLIDLLASFASDGCQVIFSTHVSEDVESADHVAFIGHNTVVRYQNAASLRQEFGSIRSAFRESF